ncbi:hypothetical protein [Streptomyces triculaminicus]|uniref:hypothetical protein n=1 Tax=Streptomyces triculaminicus TaxID=2816232 RepID=UPI0037D8D550
MDVTSWKRFERPEQFHNLLQEVGGERRKLRDAESKLKAQAEPMIVRAIQLGVSREEVAELTGYTSTVLAKWEGSAAARRAHEIKQQIRDEARARDREERQRPQPSKKLPRTKKKRK